MEARPEAKLSYAEKHYHRCDVLSFLPAQRLPQYGVSERTFPQVRGPFSLDMLLVFSSDNKWNNKTADFKQIQRFTASDVFASQAKATFPPHMTQLYLFSYWFSIADCFLNCDVKTVSNIPDWSCQKEILLKNPTASPHMLC